MDYTDVENAMATNVTASENFDFDRWKSQGELAYKSVEAEIAQLTDRLQALRENKMMLASTLGLNAPRQVATTRVPVTPMILSAMAELNRPVSVDELYDYLIEKTPQLKRTSYTEAVKRMCGDARSPLTQTADGRLTV